MIRERQTDILIVGGGLGGIAAALSAVRLGRTVVLCEETDWIGGQLTTQAVPPDEHPWIEGTGCTALYQRMRLGIRDYYRRNYPLRPETRSDPHLNPGQGRVSPLCHEPRVALNVLYEILAPHLVGRQLDLATRLLSTPLTSWTRPSFGRPIMSSSDGTKPTSTPARSLGGRLLFRRRSRSAARQSLSPHRDSTKPYGRFDGFSTPDTIPPARTPATSPWSIGHRTTTGSAR